MKIVTKEKIPRKPYLFPRKVRKTIPHWYNRKSRAKKRYPSFRKVKDIET